MEMGIARAVGAISFSIIIGLLMHLIYRKEETAKADAQIAMPEPQVRRPLWQNAVYFASMVGILVFANWARSGDVRAVFLCCPGGLTAIKVEGKLVTKTNETVTIVDTHGETQKLGADLLVGMENIEGRTLYNWIHRLRWVVVAVLLAAFVLMVNAWFSRGELAEWVESTWGFSKQILPLLLFGILISGFLLGRPGPDHEGVIPAAWINAAARRQLPAGEPARLRRRRLHVLRHTDGSADRPGAYGLRDGQRARRWLCCWRVRPCRCPACW